MPDTLLKTNSKFKMKLNFPRTKYLQANQILKTLWPYTGIFLLLTLPNIFYLIIDKQPISLIIKHEGISLLFILSLLIFFFRNIKLYLYLLTFFALIAPLALFSIYLFSMPFDTKLAGLILQTNFSEAMEISKGLLLPFIIFTIIYVIVYIFSVKKTIIRSISFKLSLVISIISTLIVWGKMFQLEYKFKTPNLYGIINDYYPASVISSISQVLFMSRNNLDKAKNFSFHAFKKDPLKDRQVYVFIIGETSRYDRWAINGYSRMTSPKLIKRNNLISYSDMISGACVTWLSVPQMITRATPDNMKLQYSEKSVLSAFREAGFETYWLSNQEPDYYTGSFTLHAEEADLCLFPTSKQMDYHGADTYDDRYLPILDSLIRNGRKDQFIVLHTMGSHWDYSRRYPAVFDYFKPSGKTVSVSPPVASRKQAIFNSYDNSIRYTDYIIDSVIGIVKKYQLPSYVFFLADHGEDIFDQNPNKIFFHLVTSKVTLHVPLFIWTSDEYNKLYPGKRSALLMNQHKKLGEENTFYTLLNMANISFQKNDSTKSISSSSFIERPQEYIDLNSGKAMLFREYNK